MSDKGSLEFRKLLYNNVVSAFYEERDLSKYEKAIADGMEDVTGDTESEETYRDVCTWKKKSKDMK